MTQKSGNKVFGFLAMSLLFLSVACSHSRPSVSKLEGLSEEVTQQEEVAKAEVEAPATRQEASTESSPTDNDFSVPSAPATTEVAPANKDVEAQVSAPASREAEAKSEVVAAEEVAVNQEPTVKEDGLAQNEFSVPVTPVESVKIEAPIAEASSVVATQNEADFAAQVQSDLDSVGRKKKKHKKWKKNLDTNATALNEAAAPEEAKKELASANVSNLIERNLLWFALAIVGGLISAFFTVRRSRKSSDTHI